MMAAASNGFIEIVEELINERDVSIDSTDADRRTALHYAIDREEENLDVVNLLLEKGANINETTINEGLSPLMMAVKRGHSNIVRQLIEKGAKID